MLRNGSFLDKRRLRNYPLILLFAFGIAAILLIATTDLRGIDAFERPLGTDFSNVWNAGRLVVEGKTADAYDPHLHYQAQKEGFAFEKVPFYGWHYPPMFLVVAGFLGLFPYLLALAIWMAGTLPLYLYVVRQLCRDYDVTWVALAFPAVFVCLGHGQNAFLTTALLGGIFVALDRDRPWLAGLLLGLLTYKPQFGILFPLVLIVGGYWRVFWGAGLGLLVSAGIATAMFGVDIWPIFLENSRWTREFILEQGPTGWEKICSVFSAFRMHGASISLAYAAQWLSAIVAAIINIWFWWKRRASIEVRASALTLGVLLSTPYFLDYDLVVLAVPIAMMARLGMRDGWRDWEKTMLVALWFLPLLTRVIGATLNIPMTPLLLWCAMALLVRRVREDAALLPASVPVRETGD